MRILSIIILAILAVAILPISNVKAQAATPYAYAYNATNLYTSADLVYEFTGLDPDVSYIWDIYTVNPANGALLNTVGVRFSFADGVRTTDSWSFGASGTDRYPSDYSGPLYVEDHFGNILGKHFVTPSPLSTIEPYANPDWFDTSGNTDINEKQVIGNHNLAAGDCQSVIYADINADGWHHTKTPCTVLTQAGDYALLHYIIDPSLYPAGTDDFITVDGILTGSLFIVAFDDIVAYSQPQTFSGGFTYAGGFSFIVLNTAGTDLPFIDKTISDAAFVTADNPHTAEFDSGAYSCERNEGAFVWISDCESIWLVSNDPDGLEWGIDATINPVGESGTQAAVTTAVTPAIWNAYNGFHEVEDVSAGYSDTTVYAFDDAITHSYVVDSVAATDVEVTWTRRAILLATNLATEQEMEFIVSDSYDIQAVVTIEETIWNVFDNLGINNDLGRNAALMVVLFFTLVAVAFIPIANREPFAYLVAWTVAGGIFCVAGFSTQLGTLMFFVSTAMLWVLLLIASPVKNMGGEHE